VTIGDNIVVQDLINQRIIIIGERFAIQIIVRWPIILIKKNIIFNLYISRIFRIVNFNLPSDIE
jgi:hypothetical protein